MELQKSDLEGVLLLSPKVWRDDRGVFWECYRKPLYQDCGVHDEFLQDNQSFSKKGTIRGMHFQSFPGQSKLVSVIEGQIFDVVVDMRKDSPTFGQWRGFVLDGERHQQLYIPVGFAHGFCALTDAHVLYKVSNIYQPATEKTFRYNDPEIGIAWPEATPILSDRDLLSPLFKEVLG